MDQALAVASACHRFKIFKAECLALLGRYPEAQTVARYFQFMAYHYFVTLIMLFSVLPLT